MISNFFNVVWVFESWFNKHGCTFNDVRVETKSQKVLGVNSYICRSYRVKTGRGAFLSPILNRVKECSWVLLIKLLDVLKQNIHTKCQYANRDFIMELKIKLLFSDSK